MNRVGPYPLQNVITQQTEEEFIKENIKINGSPTNAFGEIEFVGSITRTAKYVRVSNTTAVGKLYELLIKYWKVEPPNLIISVTGGAKNFSMRTRLMEMFQRSLIKASENTGAWITTGGTHTGVMKYVGKAVKKYAAVREDGAKKVVTIGIATWGVIYEREKLINNFKNMSKPKEYDPDESMQGHDTILDKNHSHFILVDDGSVGEYENEIDLRTKLESHIADTNQDAKKVLIVCVIVQGGPGSLKTVSDSIEKNIPVVVVKGSGGWADTLAEAWQASTKDKSSIDEMLVKDLWKKYSRISSNEATSEYDKKWTEMVKKCVSSENLLSVFDIDPDDSSWDLDVAILKALLRANSNSNEQNASQAHQQLQLAMKWNRSDIAKNFILNDDSTCIGKAQITSMFFSALQDNKPEFCKLFLDHDVDLKEYCTLEKMKELYKSMKGKFPIQLRKMFDDVTWDNIGDVLREYLGPFYKSHQECKDANLKLDPYHEIFQWALVANYQEIAKHVWEYVSESMSAAIIATKILKHFASQEKDYEKKKRFSSDAYEYERLAIGVLEKCFEHDVKKTMQLLQDGLPKWGGCTCMQVALLADVKFFVSCPGVESYMERVWMSDLVDCNPPPQMSKEDDCGESGRQNSDQATKEWPLKEKLHSTFYIAPVVKFWLNILCYIVCY